jgi:cell cycle arrest protein BUB3
MFGQAQLQQELKNPPEDGISTVTFANTSNLLLVSSWDKGVRLYDAAQNQLRNRYDHKAAVLDCCFSPDDTHGYSGGLDRNVISCDFTTGKKDILGTHEEPVKCVLASETTGLVISGAWDGTLKLWDPRAHKAIAGSVVTQEGCKVFTMDIHTNRLVVGTSKRHVMVFDVRQMQTPEQVRESSLMNQTRCLRIFPDGTGYALSSIEGRVAIEYFDPSPKVQKKNYAFKCHRKTIDKVQTLYPVNALAFHPRQGTFATGGCDGIVNVWDGANKKRICQYPAYPTSVASLSFSHTGEYLAVAASYTFEEGEKDHPTDTVFVRTVNPHEVKRKEPAR